LNPDVIVAGTADGVYRSFDAGKNWNRISPPNNAEFCPVVSLAFNPANDEILYVGTTHLPWRTTNGGTSWESIHTGMIDDSDVFSIQVNALNPASIYSSACSGLYRSSDSAGHWSKLVTPYGTFRTWFVALDPLHEGVVFAGTTGGLLRAEDGGKIFRVVSTQAVRSIAFDPNVPGRIFFASTSGGLMVSADGGRTLHSSNLGFTNRNFTALTGALGVLYTSSMFEPDSGGVYQSDNFGQHWQRASGGHAAGQETRLLTAAPDQLGTLFAVGYHGVQKSKDGGKSWIVRTGPSPRGQLTSLLALPHDTLLAATDQGLFRSKAGRAWQVAPTGAMGGISTLELSGNQILAALSAHGAFVSTDEGVTWRTCGEPSPSTFWYGLAFDAATVKKGGNQTALAATAVGLFRSTDGCRSWTRVGGGLLGNTVSVVIFHPTRSGEAFASQDGRLFRSIDGGENWMTLGDGSGGQAWPSALLVLPEAPNRVFALLPRSGVSLKTIDQ
jgi:photosystem II stability/assembly factor-like uncharacterized protein